MTAQAFWDRHAPKYAKKPIADVTAYEEKLRCVTSLLKPTDRVLEIGCGTGGTARKIAPVVAHVTATDLSTRDDPDRAVTIRRRHRKDTRIPSGRSGARHPRATLSASFARSASSISWMTYPPCWMRYFAR